MLAMLGAISVRAYAQQKTSEKISPKERWAFETNAMDWLLLLPNAKVEFDLSNSTDNRWVVGIGAKWNGNAKISMNERIQMKINDYRLEVKRYAKPSFTVKTGQSKIPKFWRTYYWGFYAGYSKFAGSMGQRHRRRYVPCRTDRRMATARIQM